jgi:hypothetical protein
VDRGLVTKFVVTYFALKEGDSMESYAAWSLDYVRSVMHNMPSVLSFLDFAVVGSMDEGSQSWDGCEIIEVTDFDEFERDNAEGEGAVLAQLWRDRLASWSIGYLSDLASVARPQQ